MLAARGPVQVASRGTLPVMIGPTFKIPPSAVRSRTSWLKGDIVGNPWHVDCVGQSTNNTAQAKKRRTNAKRRKERQRTNNWLAVHTTRRIPRNSSLVPEGSYLGFPGEVYP